MRHEESGFGAEADSCSEPASLLLHMFVSELGFMGYVAVLHGAESGCTPNKHGCMGEQYGVMKSGSWAMSLVLVLGCTWPAWT